MGGEPYTSAISIEHWYCYFTNELLAHDINAALIPKIHPFWTDCWKIHSVTFDVVLPKHESCRVGMSYFVISSSQLEQLLHTGVQAEAASAHKYLNM